MVSKVKIAKDEPLPDSSESQPIQPQVEEVEEVEEAAEEVEEVDEERPAPGTIATLTDYGVVDEYGNRIPCATIAEAKILSLLLEAKGNI